MAQWKGNGYGAGTYQVRGRAYQRINKNNGASRIHLGVEKGGPDGYDNGDFLRKWGLHKDAFLLILFMKIVELV